jgi:hypothetical protein
MAGRSGRIRTCDPCVPNVAIWWETPIKSGNFEQARSSLSPFVHGVSVVNRWLEGIEAVLVRSRPFCAKRAAEKMSFRIAVLSVRLGAGQSNEPNGVRLASRSGSPTVYEVTPEGEIEDDPDHKSTGISFACSRAKIIGFHNIPAEVIQRNRRQMINMTERPSLA